jgi:uncharacterized phiE125 gp8 family phage protein
MNQILTRTSAPASMPVTLTEAKAHLRVTGSDEDTVITDLIAAATGMFDGPNGMIGKALITQTWTIATSCADGAGRIMLTVPPVASVSSISYYDPDGISQTLDVANYLLIGSDDRKWLEPDMGQAWPTTQRRADAITVTVSSGFGDASDVPDTLRRAILLTIGHWYRTREAVTETSMAEIPLGVQRLADLHRIGWAA